MAAIIDDVEPSTSASGLSFSAALTAWRDINLSELQKTLDAQGLEIVEVQKESVVGRKRLADQTREFKKLSEADKPDAFKSLLKAYQTEIDQLTKRSKQAESSFLSVYKLLAEAPDPYPLLDAAVDQTARASEARLLESELGRQREENAALKASLAEAQALDKERKRALEKAERLEARMDELVVEKVTAKEAELNATYDERLRNYADRERDLSRQVELAKTQLRDLRSSNDSSHAKLLDHSQRQDQETVARLAELDLITADLDRANSRIAETERRNEKLRAEIESVRSGSESAERVRTLESQIADLQSETSRLLRNIDAQKAEADRARLAAQRRDVEREAELARRAGEAEALRTRVGQYADYDEIKRELDIMKYVEFSGLSMDEDAELEFDDSASVSGSSAVRLPDPNADKANRSRGKPLENLLLAKNRKLQAELTSLRVSQEELGSSSAAIRSELDALQVKFGEQRALNDRLENDLLRVNAAQPASALPNGSGTATPVEARADPLSGLKLGKRSADAAPAPTSAAETSILPIITSQRDRFRQRNAELEEELRRQQDTLNSLRSEIKALQADNVKLYEKVRYLQSYRGDASSSSRPLTGPPPLSKRDEELGKYRSLYEESMNPFEKFRGHEQSRAVSMLNPLEKLLLSVSTFVLGRRHLRSLFVIYAAALHVFVFVTLWEVTTLRTHSNETVIRPPRP